MHRSDSSLLYSSTWAIASACAIFVLVSLIVERLLFYIGQLLKKHRHTHLHDAFEKIKEELMLVGFISLALTLGQDELSKLCVPASWQLVMPQCKRPDDLSDEGEQLCPEGKTPYIQLEGLHQLHILMFILVAVHVVYSVTIMCLGIWKVHQWKVWEIRAKVKEDLSLHVHARYTRQTTFVKSRGVGVLQTNPVLGFVVAFFNQFFHSVSETDYQTLRHGFIKRHMPKNIDFDFHKYVMKSLQDDFKYVVGISPVLWLYAIFLLLVNVDGWGAHLWISLVPLIMVLALGTKLQRIITKMAIRFSERHTVVEGMPDIVPADEHFWFRSPRFVLFCIHFIMFQNALEISFYIWVALSFTSDSCLYQHQVLLVGRLIIGVVAQVVCGYITLPIYAIVAQMGSQMKMHIFSEHVQVALSNWREGARRHVKHSPPVVEHDEVPSDMEGSYNSFSSSPNLRMLLDQDEDKSSNEQTQELHVL